MEHGVTTKETILHKQLRKYGELGCLGYMKIPASNE